MSAKTGLTMSWVLLALGLASASSFLAIRDEIANDRFTNVLEWWGALLITLFFAALGRAWSRTRFALRVVVVR